MKDDKNDRPKFPSYEIGYGKPPVNRQFVKGKSGYPQGRPRKTPPRGRLPSVDPSTRERFLKSAKHEVSIREGDNVSKIPLTDAVLKAESVAALKGNTHAQKNFLDREERYKKEEAAEIKESNEYWRNYVATYDKTISSLQKAGEAIPEDWPHPDDIIFEEGQDVKFLGGKPEIASQTRKMATRFRDTLMLQAEMDRRCFAKEHPTQELPIFASDFFITFINERLPARMRLNDVQILIRISRIQTLRKPELQKQLKSAWAGFGLTVAPNAATPPLIPLLAQLGIDVSQLGTASTARRHKKYRSQ
jgi:Family of unknown function (DUF5681)